MATFNSMPALSAAAAAAAAADPMALDNDAGQPMTMDHFEPELNFDDALLESGTMAPLPFTPAYDFENFATTFEDPFCYSARVFEPTPNPDALNEASSPQEMDNKLLGFSEPNISATLLDEGGNFAEIGLTAELYGMFFVAEDVFCGENSGRPLELTCYRRNLWQCAGQITLPRIVSHLIDDRGRQLPIFELSASITAVESIEGKATEIISIPWKGSNSQATGASEEVSKVIGAPPNITLDLSTAQELDATRICLPVSWKRLQFKHATANNGRRKGLQQHYVVQISLLGKAKSGESIKIAEIQSVPVIVRGRSPRNFDSRRDVHLTGERRAERKSTASSDNATLKLEREQLQAAMQMYQSMSNDSTTTSADPANAQSAVPPPPPPPLPAPNQSSHPSKRVAVSPNVAKPPVPSWKADLNFAVKSSTMAAQVLGASMNRQNTAAPICLSLSEDEKSPNPSSGELQSPQLSKMHLTAGQNAGNSPAEDADPLYEYFPLTVDDWMPPVDAVYRPHVVHHTIVPPEIKAQQVKSKTKRYFAAE